MQQMHKGVDGKESRGRVFPSILVVQNDKREDGNTTQYKR